MIRKDSSIMKKTLKAFKVNKWNILAGENVFKLKTCSKMLKPKKDNESEITLPLFTQIKIQVWTSINAKNV